MNLGDATAAFNNLIVWKARQESSYAEIALRSRLDDHDDYVVEIRCSPGRLSELTSLLQATQRRLMDDLLIYDGEVRLRHDGDETTLWLVITRKLESDNKPS